MSRARPVVPGEVVLVTRRAHRRRFSFVPEKKVRQVFGYALATAAAKHGVLIHCIMVMSNHYHGVVTDVRGVLPDFLRDFHKEVTCGLNALRGEWGGLWGSEQTSVVRLLSGDDVLDAMVYALVNPVKAGLVESYRDWPGLHSSPASCARAPVAFARPEKYFDARGGRPDEVRLTITVPASFSHLSRSAFADLLTRRVAEAEADLQRRLANEGRRFLGLDRVRRTKRHSQPTSWEKRRGINPTLACRDTEARCLQLAADKLWQDAYTAALTSWRQGDRDTLFPAHTWKMARLHGARTAPPLSARAA